MKLFFNFGEKTEMYTSWTNAKIWYIHNKFSIFDPSTPPIYTENVRNDVIYTFDVII